MHGAHPGKVLAIAGLHHAYGRRPVLRGVDLDAAGGEILGLLGANGAGKTTLVSIVAGLLRPTAGSVRVAGVDVVAQPRAAQERIGLAPQQTGLYEPLTVAENLAFFAALAGLSRRAARQRIDETVAALRLEPLLGKRAQLCSGGERRRAHTAIALLRRPPLLLLDEPTVGADVEMRALLLDVVRRVARDDGSAVLYTTHYLHEIESLHASVAILDRGRILVRGRVEELVATAGTVVELEFEGDPPTVRVDGATVERRGDVVRVTGATAASALVQLGDAARRLRRVDIVQPSLEAAFMTLTGRRYQAGHDDAAA